MKVQIDNLDSNIGKNYCNTVIDSFGENPVFIIDDSDIVKPLGSKFEDLGIVRDGSSKNKIQFFLYFVRMECSIQEILL